MSFDYYRVLFLAKAVTDEQVKQGYKRMALIHHPTRQKVERPLSPTIRARDQQIREQQRQLDSYQMFHVVGEAYDVLGDPKRRAIYDLYGERGLKEGLPGPDGFIEPYAYHGDPHRTFREFFGTDNPFIDILRTACVPIDFFAGNTESEQNNTFKAKGTPVYRQLWLTLEELYVGCLKKVMIFKKTFNREGTTLEVTEKILTIEVQPGTPSQSQFTFPCEGDQGPNVQPADVIFVTNVYKHPVYERKENDLHMNMTANLCDSLTGLIIPIETLDQRKFNIMIVHIIRPGYQKIVENEGFPIYGDKANRGNLIITFNVNYPTVLTQAQKKIAKEALDCKGDGKKSAYTKRLPATVAPDGGCVCQPEPPKPPPKFEILGAENEKSSKTKIADVTAAAVAPLEKPTTTTPAAPAPSKLPFIR